MTSIVFQSGTLNRARLPSRTRTPAYICKEESCQPVHWSKNITVWTGGEPPTTYIDADVAAEECNGEVLDRGRFVGIKEPADG